MPKSKRPAVIISVLVMTLAAVGLCCLIAFSGNSEPPAPPPTNEFFCSRSNAELIAKGVWLLRDNKFMRSLVADILLLKVELYDGPTELDSKPEHPRYVVPYFHNTFARICEKSREELAAMSETELLPLPGEESETKAKRIYATRAMSNFQEPTDLPAGRLIIPIADSTLENFGKFALIGREICYVHNTNMVGDPMLALKLSLEGFHQRMNSAFSRKQHS